MNPVNELFIDINTDQRNRYDDHKDWALWTVLTDKNGAISLQFTYYIMHLTSAGAPAKMSLLFTSRITGRQWSAAELPVRVDAVVRHDELMIRIHHEAIQTGG